MSRRKTAQEVTRCKEICARCEKVFLAKPTEFVCPECRRQISVENGRRVGKLPKKKAGSQDQKGNTNETIDN